MSEQPIERFEIRNLASAGLAMALSAAMNMPVLPQHDPRPITKSDQKKTGKRKARRAMQNVSRKANRK